MRIAIIGLPGSGKGSQARLLSETFSIPRICAGEMLRELGKEKSALGRKVKETLKRGELVPDDLVLALLKQRLKKSDTRRGFVLDGIPRTLNQVRMFRKLFSLDKVFLLRVAEKVAVARLLKRGREDDTPEQIKKRLEIFNREIGQIAELCRELGVLVEIHTAGDSVQATHQRILAELNQE